MSAGAEKVGNPLCPRDARVVCSAAGARNERRRADASRSERLHSQCMADYVFAADGCDGVCGV